MEKSSSKKITHLLIYPFVLSIIFGITGSLVEFGTLTFPDDVTSGGLAGEMIGIIAYGFGQFLIGYYPIKLIMLLANRFIYKNKWEWPIGYRYYIIPLILYFWVNFYVPNMELQLNNDMDTIQNFLNN